MNLRSKRRLAASVMNVGTDRVIFNEEYSDLIQDAITRSTIRGLVGFGAIKAAPAKGGSRGRHRTKSLKLKRGRGQGNFKGSKSARMDSKKKWVAKVRSQRWRLKVAKERGTISKQTYKKLYRQVKGGQVRDIKYLLGLMKEAAK